MNIEFDEIKILNIQLKRKLSGYDIEELEKMRQVAEENDGTGIYEVITELIEEKKQKNKENKNEFFSVFNIFNKNKKNTIISDYEPYQFEEEELEEDDYYYEDLD